MVGGAVSYVGIAAGEENTRRANYRYSGDFRQPSAASPLVGL